MRVATAWTPYPGCSEVDGAPFTPCMGSTLGQEPSGVCHMLSQVLLLRLRLLQYLERGEGKGLKDVLGSCP